MDNLTHSLFGATLARTPLGRAGRGTTLALVLASNAPDIDIVTVADGVLRYLEWHRGPTHGLPGVAGLGLLMAALVWLGLRLFDRRHQAEHAPFARLAGICIIGVLLHIALDLPTSYGTRILSPFDWRWFTTDWMPIVDVYLLIVLGAGLLHGRGEATHRRNAAIVLTLMVVNYSIRAVAHDRALAVAPRVLGPRLPEPCQQTGRSGTLVSWPAANDSGERAPISCVLTMAALPSFVSPFEWRVVAQLSNAYEIVDVDLLDRRLRTTDGTEALRHRARRVPNQWTPAVSRAATTDTARVFLGFSRFPSARSIVEGHGTTVRFTDIRFGNPSSGPSDRAGGRSGFFSVRVRVDQNNRVVDETLGE
jgi:membrane-bound metal-dependent hydrolase YbcI (DUF457 family)